VKWGFVAHLNSSNTQPRNLITALVQRESAAKGTMYQCLAPSLTKSHSLYCAAKFSSTHWWKSVREGGKTWPSADYGELCSESCSEHLAFNLSGYLSHSPFCPGAWAPVLRTSG